MKDLIDQRNEREQIARSIVKFWNVNYVPVPYTKEPKEEPAAEECGEEKPADEYMTEAAYNATTGSYSGDYGRCEPTDEVTKGQIEKILHEKTDAIAELFDHRDEIN